MARRQGLESSFGRILDPLADKIFILGIMSSFAVRGIYSYWYLVPIYIREIAVTFCRIAWSRLGQSIGAEKIGKLKLCFQMLSISCTFVFIIFPNHLWGFLNLSILILTVLLTIVSGVSFFRTNLQLVRDAKFLRMVPTLGVGYLLFVPGTFGTLLGICFLPFISGDILLHLLVVCLFIWIAYYSISRIDLSGNEDPIEFVIDEVVGILVAFLGIALSWKSLIAGFILFRFFDVTKLFPINRLEGFKGANGIMLDDLGAGVYTWLILKILFH